MTIALSDLRVGDWVVCRGVGLARVGSLDARDCELLLGGSSHDPQRLEPDEVPARLRRPVTPEEANSLLALRSRPEGAPDARGWGEQFTELRRVLRSGTPEEQALRLHRLYRQPQPLQPPQERMLHLYEDTLLPELAHVLGKKTDSLRSRLHTGQPAFGYTAPERAEEPLAPAPRELPEGWSCEAAFRVLGERLVIGDPAFVSSEADVLRFPEGRLPHVLERALNGTWFALSQGEDLYAVAHESVAGGLRQALGRTEVLGTVNVEGGQMAFLDAEVRDDRTYRRATENPQEVGVLGRGAVFSTPGDGGFTVAALRESGGVVLVTVAPAELRSLLVFATSGSR